MGKTFKTIDDAVIRFAGDSGDGMQLTGGRFTETTAVVGNDLSTLPDFPAEIRAPAGSLAGVSAFQIHFSSKDIHTCCYESRSAQSSPSRNSTRWDYNFKYGFFYKKEFEFCRI